MPVFGVTNAMIPIIAYNYGAGKRSRMLRVMQLSLSLVMLVMVLGTLGLNLFPRQILGLFEATEEMYAIGVPALRIISWSFPLAGVAITTSSTFPPLGKPLYGLATSFTRQLVVLLPSAHLLSHRFGLGATWYSFIIAEIVSVVMVLALFRLLHKNRIMMIPDQIDDEIEAF